ncbi:MAG: hypothetical protein EPO08_17225 [Rhodospirillaceae bacterium]|nr:MAG: hypothetical protein EPO08_17225 [Rhodospirillaceae bacterium]
MKFPFRSKALPMLFMGATLLTFQGPAYAHGGGKAEHGGVLQMVGETSFELVVKTDGVELYVEDEGEETPSAGLTAKLTIINGTTATEATLDSTDTNMFVGKGLKIVRGSKVAVLVTNKATMAQTGANFSIK